MRNAMLMSTALFFIVYYALSGYMENNAIWLSLILFLVARGVIQTLFAPKAIYGLIEN
jgi:MATE family multidrug resistance protein